jgi:DNA-binding NtrC family response regulator
MGATTPNQHGAGALAKLVGRAPIFVEAIRQIPAIAKSDAPVLISGETGTGKELVARAVHYSSERAGFPFVAVNCGSMVETLLEDELFGHQRGAFTGAIRDKIGLLAQAERGTLFLDEVDTLSPKAQVDLLRVLQERKFRAVGSQCDQDANVRVLAATNASLDGLLHAGAFRVDLYYRLCVFSIQLPPLRERREDILALAAHFLEKHASAHHGRFTLSAGAVDTLVAWHWPGNVRELENAIIRGVHLATTEWIEATDLRLPMQFASAAKATATTFKSRKREAIEAFEKDYLKRLMWEHGGNVTRAAAAAQKERRDLGKLLKKYDLDPRGFRASGTGC